MRVRLLLAAASDRDTVAPARAHAAPAAQRVVSLSEARGGGHHDNVADANPLRLFPAKHNDVGKLLGADEIGIAQSLAIRIKTDAAATALPIP
jgi:hypothetical protein